MTQHGLLVVPREAVQALAHYRVAALHGDVKLGAPWQALAVQHNRGRTCGLDCGWKQVRPGRIGGLGDHRHSPMTSTSLVKPWPSNTASALRSSA